MRAVVDNGDERDGDDDGDDDCIASDDVSSMKVSWTTLHLSVFAFTFLCPLIR